MPTKAQLKAEINTKIRTKTISGSILKTEHADIADSGLDYVDQETNTIYNVLQLKENNENKSIDIVSDATSDVKYPSVKAVKTYIDNNSPLIPNLQQVNTAGNTITSNNFKITFNAGQVVLEQISTGNKIEFTPLNGGQIQMTQGVGGLKTLTLKQEISTLNRSITFPDKDGNIAIETLQTGEVTGSNSAPFPSLIYDYNIVSFNGSKVCLPQSTTVGKIVYVSANVSSNISVIANQTSQPKISFEFTNQQYGTVQLLANRLYKFLHLGNDYWFYEVIDGRLLSLNGQSLTTNSLLLSNYLPGTTSPNLAVLSNYNGEEYPLGFKIYCPNITTGGLVYTKVNINIYYSTPIGTLVT